MESSALIVFDLPHRAFEEVTARYAEEFNLENVFAHNYKDGKGKCYYFLNAFYLKTESQVRDKVRGRVFTEIVNPYVEWIDAIIKERLYVNKMK